MTSATTPDRGPVLPGLALALAVGLAARGLHGLLPASVGRAVGEVVLAVGLGLAAGNLLPLPGATRAGIHFAQGTLLRLAIVLLGATFSLAAALAIGARSLLMVAALMTLALAAATLLGRLLAVPSNLASLIAVGTAVCGNSAISAVAPVIGARDEETAYAIATNTLFGTAAVFAYPALGQLLGLGDAAYGTWAGTAVNDTSQVVAAGFAFSAAAGQVATVVKLTRNALMGPVLVLMGLLHARRSPGRGALTRSVPPFVLGFLALALLHSLGLLGPVPEYAPAAARFLILVALAGVGLATRLAAMRRIGWRPFGLGLAVAVLTSLASLLWIRWLGPAASGG